MANPYEQDLAKRRQARQDLAKNIERERRQKLEKKLEARQKIIDHLKPILLETDSYQQVLHPKYNQQLVALLEVIWKEKSFRADTLWVWEKGQEIPGFKLIVTPIEIDLRDKRMNEGRADRAFAGENKVEDYQTPKTLKHAIVAEREVRIPLSKRDSEGREGRYAYFVLRAIVFEHKDGSLTQTFEIGVFISEAFYEGRNESLDHRTFFWFRSIDDLASEIVNHLANNPSLVKEIPTRGSAWAYRKK